jgi:hypothetical protein
MLGEGDFNSGITWHARCCGLCGNSEKEQLDFLFWVNSQFSRSTVDEKLRELPHGKYNQEEFSSLPPPLNFLMEIVTGDSRIYLPPTRYERYLFELTVTEYLEMNRSESRTP